MPQGWIVIAYFLHCHHHRRQSLIPFYLGGASRVIIYARKELGSISFDTPFLESFLGLEAVSVSQTKLEVETNTKLQQQDHHRPKLYSIRLK